MASYDSYLCSLLRQNTRRRHSSKEGFVWAHSFESIVHDTKKHMGERTASAGREGRWGNRWYRIHRQKAKRDKYRFHSGFLLFSSFQSGIPVHQMGYPHSGWFIPLQVNFSGNTQTHLEMFLLSIQIQPSR